MAFATLDDITQYMALLPKSFARISSRVGDASTASFFAAAADLFMSFRLCQFSGGGQEYLLSRKLLSRDLAPFHSGDLIAYSCCHVVLLAVLSYLPRG